MNIIVLILLQWIWFPLSNLLLLLELLMKSERKIISVDMGAAKEKIGNKYKSIRSKTFNKIANAGVAITQKQINLLSKLRERAEQ